MQSNLSQYVSSAPKLKTASQMLVAVITGWQLRKCQLEEDAETESLVKSILGVCQRGLTGLAKDGISPALTLVGRQRSQLLATQGVRDPPSWRLRPDYLFARQQRASEWPSRPKNRLLMLDYSQQRVLESCGSVLGGARCSIIGESHRRTVTTNYPHISPQ